MGKRIERREFIRIGAALGAATIFGSDLLTGLTGQAPGQAFAAGSPDMTVVEGKQYFKSTEQAVAYLGGMKRFVSGGDKVALLVNCPFKSHGASVNPDITLAVIRMCLDAGAKEISFIKEPFNGYWEKSRYFGEYEGDIKRLKAGWEDKDEHLIKNALALKDGKIARDLFESDVLINVAVTKHHQGTHFSGMLKNMMGSTATSTNLYFHFGGKLGAGFFKDVDFLSQCIADLNTVRKPDLCISDTTEFLLSNGPYGPGELGRLNKVIAGTDPVAMDAYCSSLMGLEPDRILMISKAREHELGNPDFSRLNIKESIT